MLMLLIDYFDGIILIRMVRMRTVTEVRTETETETERNVLIG